MVTHLGRKGQGIFVILRSCLKTDKQINYQINGDAAWADTCQSASSRDSLIRFSRWHSKYSSISSQYRTDLDRNQDSRDSSPVGATQRQERRWQWLLHVARESEPGSTEPHNWQRAELPAMEQESLLPNSWPHKSHCYLNRSILWEGHSNTRRVDLNVQNGGKDFGVFIISNGSGLK